MTATGSTSMTFNAGSRRFKTKQQQEFTRRKIDNMTVRIDGAALWYCNPSGPAKTITTEYVNVFTDASGNIHPSPTLLGKAFKSGTKWDVTGNGTKLKYHGDAYFGNLYATLVIRPNASDNRIISVDVNDAGSSYTSVPDITFTGTGSGAEATAVIDLSAGTLTGVIVNNGGSGWGDSGTTASVTGNGTLNNIVVSKRTKVEMAIYKNGNIVNIDATSSLIGDPADAFTNAEEIHYLGAINPEDEFELRIKTDSTAPHSYHIYKAGLSIAPMELVS